MLKSCNVNCHAWTKNWSMIPWIAFLLLEQLSKAYLCWWVFYFLANIGPPLYFPFVFFIILPFMFYFSAQLLTVGAIWKYTGCPFYLCGFYQLSVLLTAAGPTIFVEFSMIKFRFLKYFLKFFTSELSNTNRGNDTVCSYSMSLWWSGKLE